MTIQLKDLDPAPEAHKPKAIILAGTRIGDVSPQIDSDGALRWHAVLYMEDRRFVGRQLLQGHGNSPTAAIADAIVCGRAHREAFTEKLAALEQNIGTAGRDDAELLKSEI